jgi:hypothetical protein
MGIGDHCIFVRRTKKTAALFPP